MKTREVARRTLDLFCRNATGPEVEGLIDPVTKNSSKELFPTKDRCGSNDPVDMNPDTQCACKVGVVVVVAVAVFVFVVVVVVVVVIVLLLYVVVVVVVVIVLLLYVVVVVIVVVVVVVAVVHSTLPLFIALFLFWGGLL